MAKEIVVKRYRSAKEYETDARRMTKHGYLITTTTVEQPNRGCLRWVTLGIFALFFKPKPVTIVTYRLAA